MEMTFPNELGQEIKESPNANDLVVQATQKNLLEEWQDEKTRKSMAQADAGEVVSHEEVKKRLSKYIK